jgi:hypothetical protein
MNCNGGPRQLWGLTQEELMSKRFRCLYCGVMATTRDHVPPRCLLEKPYPPNLKTISACSKCNKSFSLDEEYFLTVLAHIGTTHSLTSKVEAGGIVDRALSQSPTFDDRIVNSLLVTEDGRISFQAEINRISRIVQKIAYGLFILRYNKVPSLNCIEPVYAYPYNIEDVRPIPTFMATFTERFRPKAWTQVQKDVFSYIVIKDLLKGNRLCCIMNFHNTLWGVAYLPHPSSGKKQESFILA